LQSSGADILPLLQPLIAWSMNNVVLMPLVSARVAGLVTVGPLFGQGLIPGRLRVPLVLITTMFVVSSISTTMATVGWPGLTGQENGEFDFNPRKIVDWMAGVERSEPPVLFSGGSQRPTRATHENGFRTALGFLIRIAPVLISEFLIGFAISLAILICLSGLQLAGLLIDRQSGSLLGAAYDPTLRSHSTATGRFLLLFGLTVFVVMEPVGGHERMIRSLLDSFRSLPPGRAVVTISTVELLSRLVHESLQLAVQFAAPAIAAASLLAMATASLGRSFNGGTATVTGYPLRALLNLLILAASLTGAAGAFVDRASDVLDRLVFG